MNVLRVFLFIAAAATTLAQNFEVSAIGGLSRPSRAALGSLADSGGQDDDVTIKGDVGFGGRLTWNTKGYYGHEFGYLRTRGTLFAKIRDGSDVTERQGRVIMQHLFYNFMMYMMPNGERVRPFITGGMTGVQYGEPNIAEWSRSKSRNYGFNYGGGLKFKFGHAIIRLDVRQHLTGKPYDLHFGSATSAISPGIESGGLLKHLEGTLGIGFGF